MIRAILSIQPQREQPKRGARLPWTVILPWGLAGAILIGTAVLAFLPRGVRTEQPPPGRSGALVWGDGLFSNALELQAWLRIRGVSYKTWARRHPAGVRLVTPRPVVLSQGRPNAPAKKAPVKKATAKPAPIKTTPVKKARATPAKQNVKPTRTAGARATAARPSAADSSSRPSLLLPVLLAGAGLLAFIGFRLRLPVPSGWRWAHVDEDGSERRFRSIGGYAGLALVAVGLGFLVPLLFG